MKKTRAPALYSYECDWCDYITWPWVDQRSALEEFADHYYEKHGGDHTIVTPLQAE